MQVPEANAEHKAMLETCITTAQAIAPAVLKTYDIGKLILAWDNKQLVGTSEDLWTGKSRLANDSGYLEVGATSSGSAYRQIESLKIARTSLLKSKFDGQTATMHFRVASGSGNRVVSAVFDARKNRFRLRAQMTETEVWDFIHRVTKLPK